MELTKEVIETELRKKRFEVLNLNIEEANRYCYGKLNRDGVDLFFKIPLTNDKIVHILNEIYFNAEINKLLRNQKVSFKVPNVLFNGKIKFIPYMVCEYFPESDLLFQEGKLRKSFMTCLYTDKENYIFKLTIFVTPSFIDVP